MASRCSFLPVPWLLLLLLLAFLGDAAVATRPLLGIAEPPALPSAAAPGPVSASSQPGGGGGRPDRSVAGADVILVGFAAAVVVVIFLYIRVTRKSSGSVGVVAGEKQEGGGLGGF
ncbi:unnamed protein product [Urochloa humidicola]